MDYNAGDYEMNNIQKNLRYGRSALGTPVEELERPERTVYPELIDAEEDVPIIVYRYRAAIDIDVTDQDGLITLGTTSTSGKLAESLEYWADGDTFTEARNTVYKSPKDRMIDRFDHLADDNGHLPDRYHAAVYEMTADL